MLSQREEREFTQKYLSTEPKHGLSVGDRVTFTNDYGVVFKGRLVIGFSDNKIHLSGDTPYWFGINPASLKKEGK